MDALTQRLLWCRALRRAARTPDEEEDWLAEEWGLQDAMIGVDRSRLIQVQMPHRVKRYLIGLHDGQLIISVFGRHQRTVGCP